MKQLQDRISELEAECEAKDAEIMRIRSRQLPITSTAIAGRHMLRPNFNLSPFSPRFPPPQPILSPGIAASHDSSYKTTAESLHSAVVEELQTENERLKRLLLQQRHDATVAAASSPKSVVDVEVERNVLVGQIQQAEEENEALRQMIDERKGKQELHSHLLDEVANMSGRWRNLESSNMTLRRQLSQLDESPKAQEYLDDLKIYVKNLERMNSLLKNRIQNVSDLIGVDEQTMPSNWTPPRASAFRPLVPQEVQISPFTDVRNRAQNTFPKISLTQHHEFGTVQTVESFDVDLFASLLNQVGIMLDLAAKRVDSGALQRTIVEGAESADRLHNEGAGINAVVFEHVQASVPTPVLVRIQEFLKVFEPQKIENVVADKSLEEFMSQTLASMNDVNQLKVRVCEAKKACELLRQRLYATAVFLKEVQYL